MPGVRVRQDESFERALRRFRKAVEHAGIIRECKRRQHFISRSARRHQKILRHKKKLHLERIKGKKTSRNH